MLPRVRNWVFLGDSLTEGVGSKRISHVAQLVKQLRSSGCAVAAGANVHEFRLRQIGADVNRQIDFNVAGLMNVDGDQNSSDLWVWNLACEGQTIDSDFGWLPLIAALRPELVVVFRGSWPWWVPASWRGYAAMDPRCYFSTTWWRRAKQTSVDALKQRARLRLLKLRPGKPLVDVERFASYQTDLLKRLGALGTRVLVLGLLPVGQARFPGSPEHFKTVNARLKQIADVEGAEFFDWASLLNGGEFFYRDGFHPNEAGADALAGILRERLCKERIL
jgi:lysophospholipase L1-like esterase